MNIIKVMEDEWTYQVYLDNYFITQRKFPLDACDSSLSTHEEIVIAFCKHFLLSEGADMEKKK